MGHESRGPVGHGVNSSVVTVGRGSVRLTHFLLYNDVRRNLSCTFIMLVLMIISKQHTKGSFRSWRTSQHESWPVQNTFSTIHLANSNKATIKNLMHWSLTSNSYMQN